jgi:hypothetical protein
LRQHALRRQHPLQHKHPAHTPCPEITSRKLREPFCVQWDNHAHQNRQVEPKITNFCKHCLLSIAAVLAISLRYQHVLKNMQSSASMHQSAFVQSDQPANLFEDFGRISKVGY